MTGSLRCGLEEPLQPNQQILATDASGAPLLADFLVSGLNRYSFVWARAEPIPFDLLEMLLGYDRGPRSVVIGWHHELVGIHRIKSIGTERVLRAAGWETHGEQGLGLGCKTLQELRDGAFPAVPHLWVGWFAMLGGAPGLGGLRKDPFVTTVRSFCRSSKLEPSREFLEGLVSGSASVAYAMQGPSDLYGIVLVSPSTLRNHIESLAASGVVATVRHGETAASVWLREG